MDQPAAEPSRARRQGPHPTETGSPATQPIEQKLDRQGRVERERLRQDQAADDRAPIAGAKELKRGADRCDTQSKDICAAPGTCRSGAFARLDRRLVAFLDALVRRSTAPPCGANLKSGTVLAREP